MRVAITVEVSGVPPLSKEPAKVTKTWAYERDVIDYDRFNITLRGAVHNELPTLLREAMEEFKGIMPPPTPAEIAAPAETVAPAEQPVDEAPSTASPEQSQST